MIKLKFATKVPECKGIKCLKFRLRINNPELITNFLLEAPKKSRAQQYKGKKTNT